MKSTLLVLFILFTFNSNAQLYFPPTATTQWDTVSPASLGWCQDKLDTLLDYLGQHNTKAFIILKDGKIAVEKYYSNFTVDSLWYWASAAKTLTGFLTGLAQEQGYLNINDSLPKYLGHGFSSCGSAAEDSIRIIHQLTMTTGFDDMYGGVTTENHCTDDSCLVCLASPGTRWAYHNAPYSMIHWVLDTATGVTVNAFKNNNLATCGITGVFLPNGYDEIYYSKARSFARFGLLLLGKGIWDADTIMHDSIYFNQMTNTSQSINLSYGYLTWLNGKASYHLPNTQFQFPGPAVPHAPADMYAALGKNDQILNVVPSQNLVMIRMGDPFGLSIDVGNVVNDSIWMRLNDVLCSVGVNENHSEQLVSVYPNPATSKFIVSVPNEIFSISVRDLTGIEIIKRTNNFSQVEINLQNFPAGIYLIQINTPGKVYNRKVIVTGN